ncbi:MULTISPECIES: hypothetical protein [Thiothrix]|jgi:hypothetical protein|uniref:hypothetical protein n=1 Tax=Thiothrix TaxID=1030 RepID=UPI002579D93C|nr:MULTISPECIES: hypothetical protein [Thiothrix]MDX9987381.1 hypothetical protein [Thiothrix unzii]
MMEHTEFGNMDGLTALGQAVSSIADEFRPQGAYPVLGAEGSEFFVEIASGPMPTRTTHWTIYIAFGDTISHDSSIDDGGFVFTRIQYPPCFGSEIILRLSDTEAFVRLPDGAWLVALLVLLRVALGKGVEATHPLDGHGDVLLGWDQALETVIGGI